MPPFTFQTKFTRPEILIGNLPRLASLLLLLCASTDTGGEIMRAGRDAAHPVGIFCCKIHTDGKSEIRLFRLSGGEPKLLFRKQAESPVHVPIALSNAVVVVGTDGTVQKLDLDGALIFNAKPTGFQGCGMSSGRLSDNRVFVAELRKGKKREPQFFLHVLDVSGAKLQPLAVFRIMKPLRFFQFEEEIWVVGEKGNQRIKLPKDIQRSDGSP